MPKTKDLTGQRFGKLVVVRSISERGRRGDVVWECQCDCGGRKRVLTTRLTNGDTRSCGCLMQETAKRRISNIAGQRFGKLTAIRPTDMRSGTAVVWECQCACGGTSFVSVQSLKRGATRSCGCLHRENPVNASREQNVSSEK